MIISAERIKFNRPNSNKEEIGLMVGEVGRHIIIDNDMNIVINCSIKKYFNDSTNYDLTKCSNQDYDFEL